MWTVLPDGCDTAGGDPSDCSTLRGELFRSSASSTWAEKGIYELALATEDTWGYSGNGDYGFDNVTLSYPGGGGPTVNHSVVVGIATKDFFVGTLGLTPYGINFTDFNFPEPSVLTLLKEGGHIEGNSWAYTAGAYNSEKKTFGSLTLGGYDASRFVPNTLTIGRGQDISRDLLVGMQTITSGGDSLLPEGVIALVDSTIAQIWLPLEACERFESVFGLVWDSSVGLYLVNDTLHQSLLGADPTITFALGSETTGGDIVDIKMPYSSFDLTASWPLTADGASRYFPLRRADNDTQYVLGRTFLQQAYVIVDYDRNNFSVSQASFPDTGVAEELVAILPPGEKKHTTSIGEIVGIAVGAVVVAAVVVWLVFVLRKRRRASKVPKTDEFTPVFDKPELDSTGLAADHIDGGLHTYDLKDRAAWSASASMRSGTFRGEFPGDDRTPSEIDGVESAHRHLELPGSRPLPSELGGGEGEDPQSEASTLLFSSPGSSTRGRWPRAELPAERLNPRTYYEMP